MSILSLFFNAAMATQVINQRFPREMKGLTRPIKPSKKALLMPHSLPPCKGTK